MRKRRGNFNKIPSSFEIEDGSLAYIIDDHGVQLLNSMGDIIFDQRVLTTDDKRDLENLFSLIQQEFTKSDRIKRA